MNKALPDIDGESILMFKKFFDAHYKRLSFFAYQILGDKDLSEDLTQDAFLNYWKQRETLSKEEKVVKSYLYSTVKFMALNHLRHQKVVQKYSLELVAESISEEGIAAKMIRSEVLNELYMALETLPENCREVFRLGYFEGFSNSKIAEVMEISINTVKTHKQRGLKALRAVLRPESFLMLTLLF